MNEGLRLSTGKYVSVLHADDSYLPNKIAFQVRAFAEFPEAVLCHTEYQVMDEFGQVVEGLDSSLDRRPAKGFALREILRGQCDVRSVTMMYRRDVMEELGGYDEQLAQEDWQTILRLASAGPIVHVDDRLVLRRVHQNNSSRRRYRGTGSVMREIAYPVLQDVVPDDMDLQTIAARAVGTVGWNTLAEANLRKAIKNLREGWVAFPSGRRVLVKQSLRGIKSLVWLRIVGRVLPQRAVNWIRSRKRHRES